MEAGLEDAIPISTVLVRPNLGHRHLFGYGFFLNQRIVRSFCPDASFVGVAYYDNRRFTVDAQGYLTLRPRAGHRTYGVIWQVPDVSVYALDQRLCVPRFYDRTGAFARTLKGQLCISEFLATRDQGTGCLESHALSFILRAARRWEFPSAYLTEIASWGGNAQQRRAY